MDSVQYIVPLLHDHLSYKARYQIYQDYKILLNCPPRKRLPSWQGVLDTTLYDKVCQALENLWFFFQESRKKNKNCNYHGTFVCGTCDCEDKYYGKTCDCYTGNVTQTEKEDQCIA
jgi:hypothetical protein